MIDVIDTHVESTQQYVTDGSKEVSKAIDYRKKSRKKLWWIVLLVVILLAVLGFVIYKYVVEPMLPKQQAPAPK